MDGLRYICRSNRGSLIRDSLCNVKHSRESHPLSGAGTSFSAFVSRSVSIQWRIRRERECFTLDAIFSSETRHMIVAYFAWFMTCFGHNRPWQRAPGCGLFWSCGFFLVAASSRLQLLTVANFWAQPLPLYASCSFNLPEYIYFSSENIYSALC